MILKQIAAWIQLISKFDEIQEFILKILLNWYYYRSGSLKSRSGSDINKLDETELFSDLEREGFNVSRDVNAFLRGCSKRNAQKRESVM